MLNVEGFHRKSRYCKGFRAFNIIPHILKAAVPTPTEEAPVQAEILSERYQTIRNQTGSMLKYSATAISNSTRVSTTSIFFIGVSPAYSIDFPLFLLYLIRVFQPHIFCNEPNTTHHYP